MPPVLKQWSSPNFWPGRPYGPPIALVLHTEAGSEGGTEATFQNNASQVSAHYGVALAGWGDEFVNLPDRAWANGIREPGNMWDRRGLPNRNPNDLTVSIETEDGYIANRRGPQPVTQDQYNTVLQIARYVKKCYPSVRYLLRHADISPSSRAGCPGSRWIDSGLFWQLGDEVGLETI